MAFLYISGEQPEKKVPLWKRIIMCGCCSLMALLAAAIMYPIFASAREHSRQTNCLSNSRQMSQASLMYAQDYDDKFPNAGNWMDLTQKYTTPGSWGGSVYKCPSVQSGYGYAYNTAMSQLKTEKIENSSETVLIFESTKTVRNANDPVASIPDYGRHSGGNNIGYADGHAKWRRSKLNPFITK